MCPLGIAALTVNPDPVLIATEGALWGSVKAHGFLPNTVIVSDDAGQFNVGQHGLCWVRLETRCPSQSSHPIPPRTRHRSRPSALIATTFAPLTRQGRKSLKRLVGVAGFEPATPSS